VGGAAPPTREELALELRHDAAFHQPVTIPWQVVEHIAGLLGGAIKERRGRKAEVPDRTNIVFRRVVVNRVKARAAELKMKGQTSSYVSACAEVSRELTAEKTPAPAATIDKWYRRYGRGGQGESGH
jgi:hypothetical protein